jgi:tellurite resistance protein TerC
VQPAARRVGASPAGSVTGVLDVPAWVYVVTIAAFATVLAVDLFIVGRKPHAIGIREATAWVAFYVACAVAFGIGLLFVGGGQPAAEFFAGYLIEYSLSVDNLFVFVIIMTTFAVPAIHQHKVLLFGIVLALVMRGIFIALGAAAIEAFSWVFYLFGAFLIYTAIQLARHRDEEPELSKNPVLRFMERVLPTTQEYDGAKVVTKIDGRRVVTPLLIVMVAIGTTDLLFALDSIPAIFGVTEEPYLVFTANAFALMGLRQLYFLINGLLDRLVYLSVGLSVVLGFIGVKLLLHALHEDGIDAGHLGSGAFEVLPEIGIGTSLTVIVVVLAVTVVASLRKVRRDPSAAKKLGAHPTPAEELESIPEDTGSRR